MESPRGESWRARARERPSRIQARAVGSAALERIGWWPSRRRPIARARSGSALGASSHKRPDTYELLSIYKRSEGWIGSVQKWIKRVGARWMPPIGGGCQPYEGNPGP